ncbi:MAG: SpoIIE family protein phosphatase [Planctomycetota bacterium]
MSLGVKFVLAISIMVFIIMILFSVVIYAVSVSSLRSEMEDNGALLCKSVATIAESYFDFLEVQKARLKAQYLPEGKPEESLEPTEEAEAEFRKEWEKLRKRIMARYTKNLEELLEHTAAEGEGRADTKILNAIVLATETKQNLNPHGDSRYKPRQTDIYIWNRIKTDIVIAKGTYWEGNRKWPMVLFQKTLTRDRGKALVILSADKIARTQNQLLLNVILSTLIAILIGVAVAFLFLAPLVSKPVNKLLDDITIVSRGNLNHKTVPTSTDEIGVLARTFDAMTQNLKVAQQREIENQAREHDLKIATEIQAGLLPSKIPTLKGYDLDAYYRPSKEVGGDYYDFIMIDEKHMGITVADVSGKGIPGSMVMTMARSMLRMEASRNLSTAETLKKVNKVIARDIRRGMFVTALYLILDLKDRKILVSSAGHNPLVVFRSGSKKLDMVNPNGIALGFDKGPIFDRTIREEEIDLQTGDRVVLYTDGVVEAMNEKHDEYGDKRFFGVCQKVGDRNSNQFINILVNDLHRHQGKADQHDDITISTFRVM